MSADLDLSWGGTSTGFMPFPASTSIIYQIVSERSRQAAIVLLGRAVP
jgi:hypothetical protein